MWLVFMALILVINPLVYSLLHDFKHILNAAINMYLLKTYWVLL